MTRQEEIVLARIIDLRETLDKFEAGSLKELQRAYSSAQKMVAKELLNPRNKKTARARFADLFNEITAVTETINTAIAGEAAKMVAEAGVYSYKKMNDIAGWDGRVANFSSVMMSPAQITQLVTEQTMNGKTLPEWIGSALMPDMDVIEAGIKEGAILGDGYAATVRRISKDMALDAKSLRDLETVVKTYNQTMVGKAQQDVYAANKDIVPEVEWSAVLEGGNVESGRGTCPRCIALDGQKWDTDDKSRPPCPIHARCRCQLLPVTKTWKEMGLDVEEMEKAYSPWFIKDDSGHKIEKGRTQMTYHEWFASRDAAFQDKAIGPQRAELFRAGKLKLVDLVDKNGDLIPIKELSATN